MKFPSLLYTCALFVRVAILLGAAGDIDETFDPGAAIDQGVGQVLKQPDGKWIIAGAFNVVYGLERHNIARLNADGSPDPSFQVNLGPAFFSLNGVILAPDGKLYVFGNFREVNGVNRGGVARLNADGSLDPEFLGGNLTGTDGWVTSALLLSDGKLVIGGNFNKVNGSSISGFARLDTTGNVDASYTGSGVNGGVATMALQPDGKIVLVGSFAPIFPSTARILTRINTDGTMDNFYGHRVEADSLPSQVVPLADGGVLIGGAFSYIGGENRYGIARLNFEGRVDLTYGSSQSGVTINFSQPGSVTSILPQADGSAVIAGSFTEVNGVARAGLARLKSDGQLDTTFAQNFSLKKWDLRGGAISTAVAIDNSFLIGGLFAHVNGATRVNLAKLNSDASVNLEFPPPPRGLNAFVSALTIQPALGKILAAGGFDHHDTVAQKYITRLNNDGSRDSSFKNPLSAWTGDAKSVVVAPNGKIFVGGTFGKENSLNQGAARLAADGTFEKWVVPDIGSTDAVWVLAAQSDSKLLVGGALSGFVGQSFVGIGRLTAAGAIDTTFKPALPAGSSIWQITLQPDGRILVGGDTPSQFGRAPLILRLKSDGTIDSTFANGLAGPNDRVNGISLVNDKILVSGWFSRFHDQPINGLVLLNSDGSIAPNSVGLGNADVATWAVSQKDGKILFSKRDINSAFSIARLNADGSPDQTFKTIPVQTSSAVLLSDGKLLVGGYFTAVQGFGRYYLSRFFTSDPPRFNNFVSLPDRSLGLAAAVNTGADYIIQYSTNLTSGWSEYARGSSTGAVTLEIPSSTDPSRFFRIALP